LRAGGAEEGRKISERRKTAERQCNDIFKKGKMFYPEISLE